MGNIILKEGGRVKNLIFRLLYREIPEEFSQGIYIGTEQVRLTSISRGKIIFRGGVWRFGFETKTQVDPV